MKAFFLVAVTLGVLGGLRIYRRFCEPFLTVTFFDVGQGDAALVQLPFGPTLLIDAGGSVTDRNSGHRVLFPELARLGVLTLDAAILTHPDLDHGGGFQTLLEDVKAREFWISDWFRHARAPLYQSLIAQAATQKTPIRFWRSPSTVSWPTATLRVWLPHPASRQENNRSLVLGLESRGCSFLFLGDLEADAERSLISQLGKVTVLKVAHHGSRTSTTPELLRRTRPPVAVISVGRENRYGHPAPQVLARLRRAKAQILRTDFHGYVRFIVDKRGELICESAQGDCGRLRCSESPR